MARAIVELSRLSKSDWKIMSENCYLKARSYSWDDAAEAYEKALLRAAALRAD